MRSAFNNQWIDLFLVNNKQVVPDRTTLSVIRIMTIKQQIALLNVLKSQPTDVPKMILRNVEFQKLQSEIGSSECNNILQYLIEKRLL